MVVLKTGESMTDRDVINFCGEHNVLPEIEVIPASYINEAFDRVVASDVRYRFVIDNSTM